MLKGLNRYALSFFLFILNINPSFSAIPIENNKSKSNASSSLISFDKPIFLPGGQLIFTLTAGASISELEQSQSFAPLDLCRYNYEAQGSQIKTLLGGFIGSEVKRFPSWRLVAGLGYYQPSSSLSTKGILTQGVDPESDSSYRYEYQTKSQQLLAEGKLYWIAKESIQPFLMVGIGAVFNKTSNFQTSVPPFLEFTPAFSNHTKTSFTYAIGPGIDISLSKSFRIGIAYRFADLGSANTGSAQIDTIPISSTLKQSHLSANQILTQFTFIPWTRD